MNILVFGAGVLGTLYAARLQEAGHEVVILARGRRLEQIREQGLVLEEERTGRHTVTQVAAVEKFAPDDAYDLVLVLVRKEQLASVLPLLAANRQTPNLMLMSNNAAGPGEILAALGRERVLLGFPGAGGTRREGLVRYNILPGWFQPTTLGELDGTLSPRLRQIAAALRAAGFPVALTTQIDAWLKTHVALVSPIAHAVYAAGGDIYRLARTGDGLVLLVRAVREGLRVLEAHGIPVTPVHYRALTWLPEPLLVAVLRLTLRTNYADLVIARHANAARGEMQQLAGEFQALIARTTVPTPAWNTLARFLEPDHPPLPQGSADIPLQWRGSMMAATGALLLLLLLRCLRQGKRPGGEVGRPAPIIRDPLML